MWGQYRKCGGSSESNLILYRAIMYQCFRPCQTLPTELRFDSHHMILRKRQLWELFCIVSITSPWTTDPYGSATHFLLQFLFYYTFLFFFFFFFLKFLFPCPFWKVNTVIHLRDLWKSILSFSFLFCLSFSIMSLNWIKKMITKWKIATILMSSTWGNPQVSIECGFQNQYNMTDNDELVSWMCLSLKRNQNNFFWM